MSRYLIAGLGNMDTVYAGTRHNIGFNVVDALVQKHGGKFKIERLAGVSEISYKGKQLVCIKPTTYMNLSGHAVRYWKDKKNVPLENILVIVDELALPLSKLRLRPGGSDAGHNGLKSVHEYLETADYPRLRFGIGNNFPKGRQVDYVLGKWKEEEIPLVKLKIDKAVELIESFASMGIEHAMNQYNKLEISL
ncbi:MAG: aminoacyl-tRNA hydrolase [Chitinophagales bacterium]